MRLHGNHAEQQKRRLHECRKADGNNLFAPTGKSFGIPARKAEHVKTPDRNLRQENAPAFDVGKEALDDAVAKADQHQKCQQ